jgi:hypothetical protein
MHYSPVEGTVEGEPKEIYPYLGSSRLEEPLTRYPVDCVFHGHAHHGTLEGRTLGGVPVYNVSLSLLQQHFPNGPLYRIVEVTTTASPQARPGSPGPDDGREDRRRTEQPDRRGSTSGVRPAPTQH